jgi:hypothetical protein
MLARALSAARAGVAPVAAVVAGGGALSWAWYEATRARQVSTTMVALPLVLAPAETAALPRVAVRPT